MWILMRLLLSECVDSLVIWFSGVRLATTTTPGNKSSVMENTPFSGGKLLGKYIKKINELHVDYSAAALRFLSEHLQPFFILYFFLSCVSLQTHTVGRRPTL